MNKKIYNLVRERILSMEYKPGKILNEQKLAKEFGVSRTPLREALTKLEWEKLVRVLPRTGSMVTEIEFQKMVNVFQIRFELEDLAGRLAAENVREEHLDQLLTLKQACEQMKDEIDHTALATIDNKLRKIVYNAAGNDILTEISDFLYSLTQRLWSLMFKKGNWEGELKAIIREMDLTHKVLSEGDQENAGDTRRRLLDEHVQRIKGNF
jgi:DNA-binding GntR family transcriptional regulator